MAVRLLALLKYLKWRRSVSNLNHTCDFCGKDKEEVEKLIVGQTGSICDECVTLCHKILKEEKGKVTNDVNLAKFNPVKIKDHLDDFVIGQEDAKIALCVGVSQHYKRISSITSHIDLDKSNLLLVGPTGCGKTLLVKKIAEYINVPFAHADATTLTEAGYVGDDVDTILQQLLSKADGDLELASRGIVYIDEIDKISRRAGDNSATKDVGGEGVQQALLKLIEGGIVRVMNGKKKEYVELDTKNILFICGGAFVGLDKIVNKRLGGGGIGFNVATVTDDVSVYQKYTAKDLITYGLIPEFVGRFSILANVEELEKDDLVKILKEPRNNLVAQYKYLFQLDNVDLEITDDALEEIADKAVVNQTNARGLRAVLEKLLIPYQFEAQELAERGLKKIIINKESVKSNALPVLIYDKKRDHVKKL